MNYLIHFFNFTITVLICYGCTLGPDRPIHDSDKISYKLITVESYGTLQNIIVHVDTSFKSAEALENLAFEIKEIYSNRPCNIFMFDDVNNYAIQKELKNQHNLIKNKFFNEGIGKKAFSNASDSLNTLYKECISQHLIGIYEYDTEGFFRLYPYRNENFSIEDQIIPKE